ncbi:hypothetical protein B0T16DRAFT_422400 [Cercophora newfieldiana]|uniref:Ubiquitin 3 binding protein But2 C-terminal domain-containing protein n=1 Tax=Cercophora newfieldiana TaxID=92897 RepID=A0AA39XTF9_9PEZI|nr:hypothetical protein B0T16DRAFT_422400 [Cercophora newfieldiana]
MRLLSLFPSLAAAAALAPRQAQAPIVRAVSAKFLSGDGCPAGSFAQQTTTSGDTIELMFDSYLVSIPPVSASTARERHCRYEVTFEFPTGCTTGTFGNILRGTAKLPGGYKATFDPQYTAGLGSLSGESAQRGVIVGGGKEDVDVWKDYLGEQNLTVMHRTQLENQRNVTYTAGSRVYITAPDEKGEALLAIDAISISVRNVRRC